MSIQEWLKTKKARCIALPIIVSFIIAGNIIFWLNHCKLDDTMASIVIGIDTLILSALISIVVSSRSTKDVLKDAEKRDIHVRHKLYTLEEGDRAELDLARIPNPKVYLPKDGEEAVIYASRTDRQHPFYVGSVWVLLDEMGSGDTVRIRGYVTEDRTETRFTNDTSHTFVGIQDPPMVHIGGNFYNQEGVRITAAHISIGTPGLAVHCFVYDAAI